ncbi:hypothetical protein [Mucilaginibacter sp. 22184]|uniref:hypothetical protein n=1 Tax=Mucilaginibacter sp. 22184 TaxID=3453887 RepID=UPI003F84697E
MKNNFLGVLKSGVAVVAIAVLAVSCSKDKGVAPANNDASANSKLSVNAVPTSNTYTVTGTYANPAQGPAGYGTIYVDLATGAQSTSSFTAADVLFTSTNNSVIQTISGSTLKYLYAPTKTFASLKISDFAGITAVASIGRNTSTDPNAPNGWYNYVQPGGVTAIANFYILVTPASGSPYALQVTGATGDGTATSNRGVYTIKTGVINNN